MLYENIQFTKKKIAIFNYLLLKSIHDCITYTNEHVERRNVAERHLSLLKYIGDKETR